jgi:DNA-directed RNA polymerase specialized sigma24 family protein
MTDEDDIAQSVFIALCHGADAGRLQSLASRDDLWWFLLAVTRQKIISHLRCDAALKRGSGRVETVGSFEAFCDEDAELDEDGVRGRFHALVSNEPTPDFLVMLEEEHQRLLNLLRDDQLRSVAVWRIEGYSTDEIAAKLQIAPRSVTRKLNLIRRTWANEVGK